MINADYNDRTTTDVDPMQEHEETRGIPVYVMMPLDTVTKEHTLNKKKGINAGLKALKIVGVDGVMIDLWWGLVEGDDPKDYNWGGYDEFFEMVKNIGLKVQVVMSFHKCGSNVGDDCVEIPLPRWVMEEIATDPDLAYTDQWGRRNDEYVSLGSDERSVLKGRTSVQCYEDFMRSFRDQFHHLFGDIIVEIQAGMGPAGELRYPSYPEKDDLWKFPGIGAFQCFDNYMVKDFQEKAKAADKPEWVSGPTDAGHYKSWPEDTLFFRTEGGGWNSEYGKFFLSWYSQMLLDHGDRILSSARSIFNYTGVKLSVKIAGIHWHYGTSSHAPELTAGYYNTRYHDGYLPIAQMLAHHGAILNFTCIEMRDQDQQPQAAPCTPEKVVRQVALAAQTADVPLAGENALERYDKDAYDQIVKSSTLQIDGILGSRKMCALTYLRMNPKLFQPDNWREFVGFVIRMNEACEADPSHEQVEYFVHITKPLGQEADDGLKHQETLQ